MSRTLRPAGPFFDPWGHRLQGKWTLLPPLPPPGNGAVLCLMDKIVASKRRAQLGTGEGGHTPAVPPGCAVSQAGAHWSAGCASLPRGAAQGGSSSWGWPSSSLPPCPAGFYSWALFSVTSHPLFPGPALPSGRPRASRDLRLFPATRGLSPPRPEVFSAPGASPVWTGARTRLCRTPLLVTVGRGERRLQHAVKGEK